MDIKKLTLLHPLIDEMSRGEEIFWINEHAGETWRTAYGMADIEDAEKRLARFAPYIAKAFPETQAKGGLIESPLTELPHLREEMGLTGRLFLKRDSDLAVSGSVKARGGIYEVLKHAEEIENTRALEKVSEEKIAKLNEERSKLAAEMSSFGDRLAQAGSLVNSLEQKLSALGLGLRPNED